jgi:hypothetical protein
MSERRGRSRFPLQCRVEFEREGRRFTSATLNISSQGFYCLVDQPVQPGEELRCRVDLMQGQTSLELPGVSLNCEVVVLRSDWRPDGHGIACWIKNYTVARSASNGHHGRSRRRSFLQ